MQMALLREGLSHGQVGQRPYEMGYRAVQVLFDYLEKERSSTAEPEQQAPAMPEKMLTGLDVCTQEKRGHLPGFR